MFMHPIKLAGALICLALAAGCAAPGPSVPDDDGGDDPSRLEDAGRHAEAAEAWLTRAGELAGQPGAAFEARLAAARQWMEAGRPERARALLPALREAAPDRRAAFEIDLLRAELALIDRDFDTAGRLLSLPAEAIPAPLADRYQRLRVRWAEANPDSPAARVRALAEALEEPAFRPDTALALLLELPLRTLEDLRAANADRPALVPWLDLAVTARARVTDDAELAAALGDWRQRYGFEPDVAEDLMAWIRAWRETLPMPTSIAVLLPGEGPLARAGDVVREGLLAAWLALPEPRRPQLDFHYLGQDEDAAVGAWFDARERGSDFVIGPLTREQVAPLLALPDNSMPTLLLNRPRDASELPPATRPVGILALPPEEEAELAAVHALVREHERALIVVQDSDFGRRVADRFAETFELGGGRVLARIGYTAGEFDHTEALSELLELDRSENRIERLRALLDADFEVVPQRRTDFDVVFLAARGGDGLQLMPQLRFLGADDRPVFATSGIYPGGNVGSDLDGVQFPAAPWMLQTGEAAERRRRAERLFPELDDSPVLGILHALGRDALALVPWFTAMKADPALYVAGNVGRLQMSDGVVLERDLPWARIEDGRPVRYVPDDPG